MHPLSDILTTRELQRWRLILGPAADNSLGGLDERARQVDRALEWLYGRDPQRLQRGERLGGLEESDLTTPEWINAIHTLFPQPVIERLESDAVLRYGIDEVVTNLEVLERIQPSESLLRAACSLRNYRAHAERIGHHHNGYHVPAGRRGRQEHAEELDGCWAHDAHYLQIPAMECDR